MSLKKSGSTTVDSTHQDSDAGENENKKKKNFII